MDAGRLRRPPLIDYQFYIKQIPKNTEKYVKICGNIQTYTKIQASASPPVVVVPPTGLQSGPSILDPVIHSSTLGPTVYSKEMEIRQLL